jgi:hypothetical protein
MPLSRGLFSLPPTAHSQYLHPVLHPTPMLRVVLTALLAILALIVMSTIASPVALGDDTPLFFVPPEPAASIGTERRDDSHDPAEEWIPLPILAESSLPPTLLAEASVTTSPAIPTPRTPLRPASICDESHWILSIRHCPQDCVECACRFEFGVNRADWNGHWEPSSMTEFQQSLIPGVPICVMIHGSFVTEETVAEDSRQTVRWLRQAAPDLPLQVVFISWPSDGIFTLDPAVAASSLIPSVDVGILGRRAELNGCRIAKLVESFPSASPVCLIGHSHGARMVSSAMHFLGGGELQGIRVCDGPRHRVRAVLAAAAIDHDWLVPGQRYDRALCGAECVLSLRSKYDWALSIYPLRRPFSRLALGQCGFTTKDRQALGARAQQVADLDVSDMLGAGHIWPRYYEQPGIAAAIVPWVYFTE